MSTSDDQRKQRLISLDQAATEFGVSKKTIRRWISSGLAPAYRLGPRAIRVDALEIKAKVLKRIPAGGAR